MEGRLDRRTDGQTGGRLDGRTDGWTDGWPLPAPPATRSLGLGAERGGFCRTPWFRPRFVLAFGADQLNPVPGSRTRSSPPAQPRGFTPATRRPSVFGGVLSGGRGDTGLEPRWRGENRRPSVRRAAPRVGAQRQPCGCGLLGGDSPAWGTEPGVERPRRRPLTPRRGEQGTPTPPHGTAWQQSPLRLHPLPEPQTHLHRFHPSAGEGSGDGVGHGWAVGSSAAVRGAGARG